MKKAAAPCETTKFFMKKWIRDMKKRGLKA